MDELQTGWMRAMRTGDYRTAWAINDAVLAARDPASRDDPRLPYHRRWVWDGRSFRGRHVVVRCYHGLGDTLQFARYLPPLRDHVASLTLEAPPSLLELLACLPGPDRVVGFRLDAPVPCAECDLEIMELAHALRMPPDAVPAPYLHAHPSGGWPAGTVGVCWRAGGWDPARSIQATVLAAALRGRRLVVLQPEPAEAAMAGVTVLNPHGCPARLARTAGLIAGLERVVTVDTMIAHLAGGLGRPTWLLLKHDADWRWMEGRADSPWYASMRLIRQRAPGDWGSVAEQLAAELMASD